MDPRTLDRFRAIVGADGLLTEPEQLRTYECDGLTNFRVLPSAVVLPTSTEQVQAVVRVCHEARIPFVARGSGTGLSGGALPIEHGIVISLTRMNRILEVDISNARVVVEPGVLNLSVTQAVWPHYFYAPDPSSQQVCSIGGNVAENSGGAHCLKYGFTTTHVLGLEVVLPDGSLVHLGGATLDRPGYDLCGVFVGSEGTLGIATKVILRVVRRPAQVQTLLAAFHSTNQAGAAVSGIIAAGVLPAAIEMMDNLAIQAAEAAVHAGYPDCGGLLLVELDGPAPGVAALMGQVREICPSCGAWELRVAQSELPGAAGRTNLAYLPHQSGYLRGRAVELDQQQAAAVRIARVHRRLGRLDRQVVHHLDRSRQDARGDDPAHRRSGLVGRMERREQRLDLGRSPHHPENHFRRDPQGAFGPDEHAAQIVSRSIERGAAEVHERAVREHHLQTEDVRGGEPILEAVGAARVLGDVAADGTHLLRGRVRGIEVVGRDGLGHAQVEHTRLHHDPGIRNVDVQNAIHPRQADHDAVRDRQGTAGEPRARAAGDEGNAPLVADADDGLNLLRRGGQHDGGRDHAKIREAVALIGAQLLRLGEQPVAAHA